jgi:hypothetical protein
MNLNYVRILIGLLLFLLVNGCTTQNKLRCDADKAYVVRAVFVEMSESQLKELGLTWILNESKFIAATDSSDVMEKLFSTRQSRATQFPLVYLNVGELNKVDEQHPVKFATAYNEEGRPIDYDTRGVGRMIEIGLISISNGMAQISYQIEDTDNPSWITYEIGKAAKKVKQPVFSSTSLKSPPPGVILPLNGWMIMGGLIKTLDDGSQLNVIEAIQVKENKSPTIGSRVPATRCRVP